MIDPTGINTESTDYERLVTSCKAEREAILSKLAGYPVSVEDSNFYRGQLYMLDEIINLREAKKVLAEQGEAQ